MSTEDTSHPSGSGNEKPRGRKARKAVKSKSGVAQAFHQTAADNGGSRQKRGHDTVLGRLEETGHKSDTQGGSRSYRRKH